MSKGKKSAGKQPPAQDVNWEQALKDDKLMQDDWKPYVLFADIEDLSVEDHVNSLLAVVDKGYRRKFGCINKKDLISQAEADMKLSQVAPSGGKKSKQATAPSSQIPHIAICEHAVSAAEQGTLTDATMVKLLKYRMLRMKDSDIQKRLAKLSGASTDTPSKGSGGNKKGAAGKSAGKSKGKSTPSAAAMETSVPMPSMPPSTMMKRGEEGDGPPPINDEPVGGPDYYYIISGFGSLKMFEEMDAIGIKANALCKVLAPDPQAVEAERQSRKPLSPLRTAPTEPVEESEAEAEGRARERHQRQSTLIDFWDNIDNLLELTETGSMLRDMAQVEISTPRLLVPDKIDEKEKYGLEFFHSLASKVYDLLDSYTQYQRYLGYVRFLDLSPPTGTTEQELFLTPTPSTTVLPTTGGTTPSVIPAMPLKKTSGLSEEEQKRHYNQLLNVLPQESVSVPIILHSMVEQVVCTVDGGEPCKQDYPDTSVFGSSVFTNFVSQLALPDEDKKNLILSQEPVEDKPIKNPPAVIRGGDEVARRHHHTSYETLSADLAAAEQRMLQLSLNARLAVTPGISKEAEGERVVQAQLHALKQFVNVSELSPELFQSSLIQLACEQLPCSPVSHDPTLKRPTVLDESSRSDSTITADYPLPLQLVEQTKQQALSEEKAIVLQTDKKSPVGDQPASPFQPNPPSPTLDLGTAHASLVQHAVREKVGRDVLLQVLQSRAHRKPYQEWYYHKLCNALLLVLHSGRPGESDHSYAWQEQMMSPFGFNNYLKFVSTAYEDEIDHVMSLDEERREIEEEQWKKMTEEKQKERQAAEALAEEAAKDTKKKPAAKGSADKKGKKGGKESSAGTKSVQEPVQPEDEEFHFEPSTAFAGYMVGDKVLKLNSTVSTMHCPDQHQVKIVTCDPKGEGRRTLFSVIGPSTVMNVCVINASEEKAALDNLKKKLTAPVEQQQQLSPRENKSATPVEGKDVEDATDIQSTAEEESNVLQPPEGVEQALFSATVDDYIHLSTSGFGPRADGSLPIPPEPSLKPSLSDTEVSSRPESRKSATPKKLSKKEQEAYQQQLLEQQRQQEKEQEEQRERLMVEWRKRVEEVSAANQVQQLSLSTVTGLHLRCQVLPALSGEQVNQVVIRQTYSNQTEGSQECEKYRLKAYGLQSYVLYPDGTLCIVDREGRSSVLTSDGTVYRSPSSAELKVFTEHLLAQRPLSNREPLQKAQAGAEGEPVARSTSRVAFSGVRRADTDEDELSPNKGRSFAGNDSQVWVVSLPSGERYMWQQMDISEQAASAAPVDVVVEESTEQSESPVSPEEPEEQDNGEVGEKDRGEICVPLPTLGTNIATDPVTNEEMLIREDGLMILRHPSGTVTIDHPNGVRFTTTHTSSTSGEEVQSVTVEHLGFATVQYTLSSGSAHITLPNGASVNCSPEGEYSVSKEGICSIHMSKEGVATYESQSCTYQMKYRLGSKDDTVVKCFQSKKDFLSAGMNGAMTQFVPTPWSPDVHAPEYYVLDSGGEVYRLLTRAQLEETLQPSPSGSRTVLQDICPGDSLQKSVIMLEPHNSSDPLYHVVPLMRDVVVPPNLKKANLPTQTKIVSQKKPRFGISVGKSLMIGSRPCPVALKPALDVRALVYRQFVAPYQEAEQLRASLVACLTKFTQWRVEQETKLQTVQPSDLLSDEEKEKAADLLASVKEDLVQGRIFNGNAFESNDSAIWKAYFEKMVQTAETKSTSKSVSPIVTHTKDRKEANDKEREEAEVAKLSLRSGVIPKYFSSDPGRAFLAQHPPDIQALALKLAQPRLVQAAKAKVSFEDSFVSKSPFEERGDGSGFTTPSTTCSTAVPMGEMSPSPIELGQMVNNSTLRPQNPTPYHADGKGTPTESRPLNPTPGHASRDAMTLRGSSTEEPCQPGTLGFPGFQGDGGQGNFAMSEHTGEYNEGESQIADTIAGLDQEDTVAGSEANQFESKDLDEVDPPSKHINNSTYFTVTGTRRKTEVPMPSSLMGSRPGEIPNKHFASVEEPVRRKVMTSSVAKPLATGMKTMPEMRGFELHPKEVVFGVLKEGFVYGCTVTVKNIGVDTCRYRIKQPPPSTGLKIRYTPGPLAAGLKSSFDIEIYAMAVGAIGDSGIGAVRHVLEIITETSHLHLPITAIILTHSAYEKRLPIHPQGRHAQDVRLLSERPASRERLDRPHKDTVL